MAVPCTPASEGFHPTPHTPDWATARPRYLPLAGPFTDRALWVRVIRYARCADDSRDPEQRFPVSVQIEKVRQEAAAAIAACTICPASGAAWSPPNMRPCAVSCAHSARHAPASISHTGRRSWCGRTGLTGRPIAEQTDRASDRQADRREWRRTARPVRGYAGLGSHGLAVPPARVIAGLIVGDATGQVAGVGDLAGVGAATGGGAGLADASRITPRSCR